MAAVWRARLITLSLSSATSSIALASALLDSLFVFTAVCSSLICCATMGSAFSLFSLVNAGSAARKIGAT